MNQTLVEELTDRIDRLETDCRCSERRAQTWRRTGVAIFIGSLVIVGGAANLSDDKKLITTELCTAQEFALVGKDGNVRAILGTKKGLPYLAFLDNNHVNRVQLTVSEEGSKVGMTLLDGDQEPRLILSLVKDGTPEILMRGSEGGLGLSFDSKNGKREAALSVEKGPLPTLRLFDRQNRLRVRISPEDAERPK